jgi:hypothetical protein
MVISWTGCFVPALSFWQAKFDMSNKVEQAKLHSARPDAPFFLCTGDVDPGLSTTIVCVQNLP